jgi:hypothetical protein
VNSEPKKNLRATPCEAAPFLLYDHHSLGLLGLWHLWGKNQMEIKLTLQCTSALVHMCTHITWEFEILFTAKLKAKTDGIWNQNSSTFYV